MYNFQSTALSTFVPACNAKSMKLLLPDPTEREIKRHIRDRSQQALDALEQGRRKAPFSSKWKRLEQTVKNPSLERFKVHKIARTEWDLFLRQFKVVRLGYDLLKIEPVMDWYDRIDAPFSDKKRKEFPDAFAIAMLDAYAHRERVYVAVVSADSDFKLACQRFSSLLHFQGLPQLTELLLSDDARHDAMRKTIDDNIEILHKRILNELVGVGFYHTEEGVEVIEGTAHELQLVEPSIVAIGDGECTITFHAAGRVHLKLEFPAVGQDGLETVRHSLDDDFEATGTAKLTFQKENGLFVGVVTFDQDELEVTRSPYRRY